jgi:hypothetical protein
VFAKGSSSWKDHEREMKVKATLKLLVTRIQDLVETVDGVGSLRSGLQVCTCGSMILVEERALMLNINTDERHFVDSGYEKDIVRIGSVHGYRAIAGQAKSAVLCSSIVSTVSLSG